MKRSVTYLSSLLGALFLVTPAARGEGRAPTATELVTARQLFADAAVLEAHSEWTAAAGKLKSALAIKETPGLRYHLAHCEEQLNSFVEALGDYDRAAELLRDGAAAPDVAPLLALAQRRLESRIAKLDLVVPAGTAATAELDDHPLPASALGTSIRLDPGVHHVLVRAPGHTDYHAQLSLSVGEHRTLKVFFPSPAPHAEAAPPVVSRAPVVRAAPVASEPPRPAETPLPAPDQPASVGLRTPLFIAEAAVAAVGLGFGIGFAVARPGATTRVRHARAEVDAAAMGDDAACADGTATAECADLAHAIDTARNHVTFEKIGFIGAGVGAGLFVLTWVLWPSANHAASLSVGPATGGAVLSARGAF